MSAQLATHCADELAFLACAPYSHLLRYSVPGFLGDNELVLRRIEKNLASSHFSSPQADPLWSAILPIAWKQDQQLSQLNPGILKLWRLELSTLGLPVLSRIAGRLRQPIECCRVDIAILKENHCITFEIRVSRETPSQICGHLTTAVDGNRSGSCIDTFRSAIKQLTWQCDAIRSSCTTRYYLGTRWVTSVYAIAITRTKSQLPQVIKRRWRLDR